MKVYVNDGGNRKIVEAKLIKDMGTTMRVQLADGNIIKRKKSRDIPQEVGGK